MKTLKSLAVAVLGLVAVTSGVPVLVPVGGVVLLIGTLAFAVNLSVVK